MKPFSKLFLLYFTLITAYSNAQSKIGNEWINKDFTYFKIKINTNGVYRINYSELKAAGMDIDNINPKNLQMVHHGKNMAVWVEGESDGKFNTTDFIEFYAEGNTGIQDTLVYRPVSARMNKYNSLFSKDTYYYLAITSLPGTRIKLSSPTKTTNMASEPYHMEDQVVNYQDQYSFNISLGGPPNIQQSYYEFGEGWTGKVTFIKTNNLSKAKLNGLVKTQAPTPVFEALFNGRSISLKNLSLSLKGKVARTFPNFAIDNFDAKMFRTELLETDLTANDSLLFNAIYSSTDIAYNYFSVTYINIKYPQLYGMYGEKSKMFYPLINPSNTSLININDCKTNVYAYNLTDFDNQSKIALSQTGTNAELLVEGTSKKQKIHIFSTYEKALSISKFDSKALYDSKHDFLIITHTSLMSSSKQYAQYRSSIEGGSHTVGIEEMQKLYDFFTYGEKNPLAIKRYLKYLDTKQTMPVNLLLIGRSVSFPDKLIAEESQDLVPTFGYPGSDILLSSGLKGYNENTPSVFTGRIPATKNADVINYLNKVKEYEQLNGESAATWRNNITHISGGKSYSEISSLRADMDELEKKMANQGAKLNFEVHQKNSLDPTVSLDISEKINRGVGMITFLGHSSEVKAEMDLGRVTDTKSKIENKGKYPLMYYTGCSIGNCFKDSVTFSTDWLLAANKGSIAFLSNTLSSYQDILKPYMQKIYTDFFIDENNMGESLGKIQQIASANVSTKYSGTGYVAHVTQTLLMGDPSLVIFPTKLPDFSFNKDFFQVSSKNLDKLIQNDDSLVVKLLVSNSGNFNPNLKYEVVINKKDAKDSITTEKFQISNKDRSDTLYLTIKNVSNLQSIEFYLDKDNKIKENNETNNTFISQIDGKFNSFPLTTVVDKINPLLQVDFNGKRLSSGDYIAPNTKVTMQLQDNNFLAVDDPTLLRMYLSKCGESNFDDCVETEIDRSALVPKQESNNQVTYELNMKDLTAGNYEFRAIAKDTKGNKAGIDYTIRFKILNTGSPTKLLVYPNPITDYATFELYLFDTKTPKQVEIKLFDLLGRELNVFNYTPILGKNEFPINFNTLSNTPKTFFYTLTVLKSTGKLEVFKGQLLR